VASGERREREKKMATMKSPLQGKSAGLKPGLYKEKSERDG